MNMILAAVLLITAIYPFTASYNIRIGMLFPYDDAYLKPLIGYETSASAVTIALDRVRDERLLVGASFSFLVRNCECREDVTAGYVVEMLEKKLVDVIISSPCAPPAFISAVLCAKYNIPLLNWAVTTVELDDSRRFETVTRTIGSASRIGRALGDLLGYFGWNRVAFLFTDDGLARKCHSIAQGTATHLPKAGIQNVYTLIVEGDDPSDKEIDLFLDGMQRMARVAIICVDQGIRRVMLRAQERGMTTEDYVYVLPEYVQNENRTDLWTSASTIDGRNTEAKAAFNASLFGSITYSMNPLVTSYLKVEMQLASSEELHYFKKRIPEKMRLAPFIYTNQKTDEFYGSLYAPFLHDAVYLYALALNRTIGNGSSVSDGRAVVTFSRAARFQGVSGYVVTDDTASRDPTFVVKALDKNKRMWNVANLLTFRNTGDMVELLVPESTIWESRGGRRPSGEPLCGWANDKCIEDVGSVAHWIAVGVVGSIVIVVVSVSMAIYFVNTLNGLLVSWCTLKPFC